MRMLEAKPSFSLGPLRFDDLPAMAPLFAANGYQAGPALVPRSSRRAPGRRPPPVGRAKCPGRSTGGALQLRRPVEVQYAHPRADWPGIVLIEGDKGVATGFLAKVHNLEVVIVTNLHCRGR